MVSQRHYQRLQNLLKETNGEIVIGGKTKDDGNYIEPTVVVNVKMDDALLRDELFGPILPIVEVKDINEAIKIVRADEKPLASYCFGKFLIFQITEKIGPSYLNCKSYMPRVFGDCNVTVDDGC